MPHKKNRNNGDSPNIFFSSNPKSADLIDEAQNRYNHSEKGKKAQQKYSQSEKGKASQSRYSQSEKGKLAQNKYRNGSSGKKSKQRFLNLSKITSLYIAYEAEHPGATIDDYIHYLAGGDLP